jgi:hypothetical protein
VVSLRSTRRLATLAVIAGVLAVAGPASAASAVPHHDDARVFMGDAYDNEMGITNAGGGGDGIIAVLIGL